MLHDARILAVEYKGKHLSQTDDSAEKRAVGAVWESRSNGKCLFVMPDGPNLDHIAQKIIL